MWAILVTTLPTQPNAVRVRVWRALKAMGCAALRDGAYLLPSEQGSLFEPLAAEVREHGGAAMLLTLMPRDEAQRDELLALFDRTDAYAQWRDTATALHAELESLAEGEARRRLRTLADALQSLSRIDYYPGSAAAQAQAELESLRQALDARFSQGEPQARVDRGIARLDARKFRGKRWATRARPWVDRLACAWLIRRFIDPRRALRLAARPGTGTARGDRLRLRRRAVHACRRARELRGHRRELRPATADARLQRIARAVHYLDVGGIPAAEAAGLEGVLAGLRELHADDDALAAAHRPGVRRALRRRRGVRA